MRLATVNCILLACIATAIAAEPRPKRDLLYLKNFLTSKLFGSSQDTSSDSTPELIRQDGDIKIFRIPGFDNILVKAIPKSQAETIKTQEDIKVIEHPTIAILKSYLGTKSQGETLSALQGIKNLIKSGILNAQHDLLEILPVKEPCLPKPVLDIPEPPKVPLIPSLPPTVVSFQPIKPLYTPYSYKQIHLDGNVTTYTSQDGHDVIVTETNKPMPLPPSFILDRLQQVVVLGMRPVQAIASVVPKPVVNVPLRPVLSPVPAILQAPKADVRVNSYSFRQHHHDDGVTTYFGSEHSPVVVEQQAFVRPPLPYIETIEASALSTNLPKAPSGYRFKIVSNANGNDNVARRVFYNSPRYYQSPQQMPTYVYKKITPSLNVVEDSPRFDTKGEVHVNVNNFKGYDISPFLSTKINPAFGGFSYKQHYYDGNGGKAQSSLTFGEDSTTFDTKGNVNVIVNRGNFKEHDLSPFLSSKINHASGGFSYKQHHNDGTVTSYSGDKIASSPIKETIKVIPPLHIHNVDRIENAANAHGAPLPKLWAGYSFKIGDNGVYMNNIASNQETTEDKQYSVGTGTQGISGLGAYAYKHVNNGDSNTDNTIDARKEGSSITQNEKASSGYSFKIVSGNGGKVQSNIDATKNGGRLSSSGAYSFKQFNNDGSSTTFLGTGETNNGNSAALEETTIKPALSIYFADRIEKVASQAPGVEKASLGYSFKIVNGDTTDKTDKNIGMPLINAASDDNETGSGFSYKQSSNDGSSTTYFGTNEGKNVNSHVSNKVIPSHPAYIVDRLENVAAKAHSAEKTSSGYSFKIVNGNTADQTRQNIGMASLNAPSNTNSAGSGSYYYKQVSSSGASTSYAATGYGKDGHSDVLVAEGKTPVAAPPAYIFNRNENISPQAHVAENGPSKYSFEMVNNQAFVNSNGEVTIRQDNKNIEAGSLKIKTGEKAASYGGSSSSSGAYSYKLVNNAGTSTTTVAGMDGKSDVLVEELIKSVPTPPTYIVDRMKNVDIQAHASEKSPSGYSFKIVNNQASMFDGNHQNSGIASLHLSSATTDTHKGESSSGLHSYKQSHDTSALNTETVNGAMNGESAPSSSGYSFKLVNNQVFTSNAAGEAQRNIALVANGEQHGGSSSNSGGYSYTQIGSTGTTTTYIGADEETKRNPTVLVSDSNKGAISDADAKEAVQTLSGYSFNIANNIQGADLHSESEKHETVMFTEPVTSRYVYKQIITNNPQPFTVVRVEDKPTVESNGDLTVKVNTHMHINSDGTKYLCDEKHVPYFSDDYYENVPEVQNGFVYVPPAISQDTMTEKKDDESDTANSLSKNPIVVAPIDPVYSFKQSKADGSSVIVNSSSQNAVSVSVNEGQTTESYRGDIPIY